MPLPVMQLHPTEQPMDLATIFSSLTSDDPAHLLIDTYPLSTQMVSKTLQMLKQFETYYFTHSFLRYNQIGLSYSNSCRAQLLKQLKKTGYIYNISFVEELENEVTKFVL